MGIRGLAIWVVLMGALLGQDVVLLRSGARLEGQVVAETTAKIHMTVPGGTMEFNREDVLSVEKGKAQDPSKAPTSMPSQVALAALNRFADAEDWFLLEKGGRRLGWRVVTASRELKCGVPTYARRDRIVIPPANDSPELESIAIEWVDASLRPVAFSVRSVSGSALRTVDGIFTASGVDLTERSAGIERKRHLPSGASLELPGFLLKRRGFEPSSEVAVNVPIFDPRRCEVVAGSITKSKAKDTSTTGSRVRILGSAGSLLSSMELDSNGRIFQEELGGADLVAVRTDPKTVAAAIAQGFAHPTPLKRVTCPELGVTIDRPDDSWISMVGTTSGAPVLSMWHPKSETSVEFFTFAPDRTVDEILAECAWRIAETDPTAKTSASIATLYGELEGYRISIASTRRGRLLSTTAFVAHGPLRPMLVLVSTPNSELGRALDAAQILGTLTKVPATPLRSAE